MIRLVYAEESLLERLLLKEALNGRRDLCLAGVAQDGREAAELAVQVRPDVVLLSEKLAVMDGYKSAQLIRALQPESRILLILEEGTPEALFRAMQAGVWKCLFRPTFVPALVEAALEAGYSLRRAVEPVEAMPEMSGSEHALMRYEPEMSKPEPRLEVPPSRRLGFSFDRPPLSWGARDPRARRATNWAPIGITSLGVLAAWPLFDQPAQSVAIPLPGANVATSAAARTPLRSYPGASFTTFADVANPLDYVHAPSAARLRANMVAAAPVQSGLSLASGAPLYNPMVMFGAASLAKTPGRAMLAAAPYRSQAPSGRSRSFRVLILRPTQSSVLEFNVMSRVVIANPLVADVVTVSDRDLVVLAKGPGETTLYVWDKDGRHTYRVVVENEMVSTPSATANLEDMAEQLRQAINNPDIHVRTLGQTIFLEGMVKTEAEAHRAEMMAQALTSNYRNVIQVEAPMTVAPPTIEESARLLQDAIGNPDVTVRASSPTTLVVSGSVSAVEAERIRRIMTSADKSLTVVDALGLADHVLQQIQIRARVVDINRTKLKNLGITWGQVNEQQTGVNRTITITDQPFLFGLSDRGVQRLLPIGARLNALINENAARILSEPNLLVLEGATGTILAGGEFPIPIVQNQVGGVGSITVQFKEFGVRLKVVPASVSGNEITMEVNPEVSLLDFANAVTVSGITLPALQTRREDTTIRMQAGQTLAIGGLIENNYSRSVNRIPFLSKIPVLGELFKSKSWTRNESELVILITPEIVPPGSAVTKPLDSEAGSMTIPPPVVPEEVWPGINGKKKSKGQ